MTDNKIPSAEEIFQEEANFVLREGTYEFQVEKVLEEIKKLDFAHGTDFEKETIMTLEEVFQRYHDKFD